MADPVLVALQQLEHHHREAARIAGFLASYRKFGGELPPLPRRSGETTGPTAKPTPPVANSSAMTACPHVVGEGQEHLASASPTHAPLDKPSAVQSEAAAGAYPGQGSPVLPCRDGATHDHGEGEQFVTASGAGEGIAVPADPAPGSDPISPALAASELPASDGVKGGASASSSPERDVSSQRLPASASSETAPAFSREAEQRRKALDFYAENDVSVAIIATRFGCQKSTVQKWIEKGRETGLDEIKRGDIRRGRKKRMDVPEVERRVPRHAIEDDRPLPKTGAARGKSIADIVARQEDLAAIDPKILEGASFVSVGPIAIDEKACIIAGPTGVWRPHVPCIRILVRLAKLHPGSYLDADSLSRGTMAKARILESVPVWTGELARIGIELGRAGENFYLKRMETAA